MHFRGKTDCSIRIFLCFCRVRPALPLSIHSPYINIVLMAVIRISHIIPGKECNHPILFLLWKFFSRANTIFVHLYSYLVLECKTLNNLHFFPWALRQMIGCLFQTSAPGLFGWESRFILWNWYCGCGVVRRKTLSFSTV